jgi:hypothetical protein
MKKSRGMGLARHESGRGRNRGAHRILVRNLKDRYHLEKLLVLGTILLKLLFKKQDGRLGLR